MVEVKCEIDETKKRVFINGEDISSVCQSIDIENLGSINSPPILVLRMEVSSLNSKSLKEEAE